MKEVEAYRIFGHVPGIIHSIDHAVATERGADEQSKTVYVLLPFYKRGNLQDMINANLVNGTRFPERKLMVLFLGVCRALKSMHQYKGAPVGMERMEMGDGDTEPGGGGRRKRGGKRVATLSKVNEEDEEREQERGLLEGEGPVGEGGIKSYAHRDIKPGMGGRPFPSVHLPTFYLRSS